MYDTGGEEGARARRRPLSPRPSPHQALRAGLHQPPLRPLRRQDRPEVSGTEADLQPLPDVVEVPARNQKLVVESASFNTK